MRCPSCQTENREGRRFCAECGASLAPVCAACGFSNEPGEKFCGGCGQALRSAAPGAPAPKAYTPPHLAQKILTTRSALEGERKQVTVLFCDVVDSTRLASRLDPEVMHEVMDRALRLMAEAIHRYEGTVNQFLGDGLMALFGAPVALEDHALRAVEAALAIQETLGGYSESLKRERETSSGYASASIRASWSSARSATTCAWITLPSAAQRISPRACSPWPSRVASSSANRLTDWSRAMSEANRWGRSP